MTTNLNNALALAARGLPVFPVWWMAGGACACGAPHPEGKNAGKHPMTPRGLNDASADPEQIAKWWALAPEANIGVAVPDGVVVVDVDPRNGGEETFDALEAKHGKFPITRTVITGGAGGHFYYRAAGAFPSTLGPGIDVKQLGGYVLAPPSNHASGSTYRYAADSEIVDAPAWLASLSRPRGERVTVVVEDEESRLADDTTLDQIVALLEPHFLEGKKHHIAKNLGGWMKQRGFGPGDVAHVVERLPSKHPQARAKAAVAAFGIERAFGWTELRGLLGEAPAAALDACTPNPRRAAQAEVTESLVEAMAAAVRVAPMPAPLPAGQMPAWYVPVNLREVPAPLDFVVPELELATGGRPNMIVGYSNAGKSIAAQALAFAIAMGLPAWGRFPVRRRRVLYLDAENILVTRENFARLAYAHEVPLAEMAQQLVVVDSALYLDGPNSEAELACVIRAENFGAVFVDTYRASTQVAKENDMEFARPLYMLKRVSVGLKTMFTVVHHEKKPTDGDKRASVEHMISGHNAIHGAIQVGISLIHDDANQIISVRPSKKIRKGFEPFHLKITDVGAGSIGEAVAAGMSSPGVRVEFVGASAIVKPPNEDTMAAALLRILLWLRANAADGRQVRCDTVLRTRELGGVGGKKSTNIAAMERLERDGQVHMHGSPKMIALVVDAPAYDPRSIAPPESADRPPISQSIGDFGAALPRRDGHEG